MLELAVISQLAYAYLTAKEAVIDSGYAWEIEWQQHLNLDNASATDFLRESAWVILSGGMREAVVRKCFPGISAAFLDWNDTSEIVASRSKCIAEALRVFNHQKKIDAIADIAFQVHQSGIKAIKAKIKTEGTDYLQTFPYIGPVTSFHLAKNLGLDVVKPDRHLLRVAAKAGYSCPTEMCQVLASVVGDKLSVIDIVIWRFATLNQNYLDTFTLPAVKELQTSQRPN